MEGNKINPAPLGLAAFGLTTVLLNLINAGIIPHESLGMVLPLGLFFGGLGQVLAGNREVAVGNTFGSTAFTAYGGFWLAFATMVILENLNVIAPVPKAGLSAFLAGWGLFTLYMTIPTLKKPKALFVVFSTLTILFFLLAIGVYYPSVHTIAGYEGLICGGSALYLSAADIINETFGREALPIGKKPIV
ncbi:MAG: acetate uptake transporter [Candidatus Methanofastidiosa archaeon]|nr:acetate uptake transporter [Candidatus Methanofastidiosa archaeon]